MQHVFSRHTNYPDEEECPECGFAMELSQDVLGWSYRCEAHDCGQIYTASELFSLQEDEPVNEGGEIEQSRIDQMMIALGRSIAPQLNEILRAMAKQK